MTYILNLTDLLFTLHALSNGAIELNPLMRCIPFQIFFKVVVVGVLCLWLGTRREPIARIGLLVGAIAFGAVDLWHIFNLFLLGVITT